MIRKALLGSTAIFAAVLAAPTSVDAGTVGTGDNLEVSIFGEYRFHIALRDEVVSSGFWRGYIFRSGEAEIGIEARNTADNGILYGVEIILNVNTDDTANAEEAYAFIDDENLGRLELGDQDDAIDRMFVAGEDALVGRQGWDGEVGNEFNFGTTWIGAQNNNTAKSTKVTYFSPRIAGFQVGASITPDSGSQGDNFGERDDDGDFENVIALAANYVANYNGLSVVLSIFGEF
ncbi:MAG: porin, partial [Alphaproteobacteria bacterium]